MKKLKLFSLLMLLFVGVTSMWGAIDANSTWTATAFADIPEGSTVIIINNFGKTLANATVTKAPAKVELSYNSTTKKITVSTAGKTLDDVAWTTEKTTNGTKFWVYGSNTELLGLSKTNDNNAVAVNTTENAQYNEFVLNGGLLKYYDASRFVGEYVSGSDWRSYTSATANNYKSGSTTQSLTFYVLDASTEPGVSFDPTEIAFGNVKLGESVAAQEFTILGENLTSTALTATSSNTSVFTVAVKEGDSLTPDEGEVLANIVVTPITTAYGDYNETITINGGGLGEDTAVVAVSMHVGGIVTVSPASPNLDFGNVPKDATAADYAKTITVSATNLTANKQIRIISPLNFQSYPTDIYADANGVIEATEVKLMPITDRDAGSYGSDDAKYSVTCTGTAEFESIEIGAPTMTIVACTTLDKPSNVVVSGKAYPYNAVALAWAEVENADSYEVYIYQGETLIDADEVNTEAYTIGETLDAATTYTYQIIAKSNNVAYCESAVATANFTTDALPDATLTLSENTVTHNLAGDHKQTDVVTLPSTVTNEVVGKVFVGWDPASNCTAAPTYAKGASYTLSATSQTLYAVYATKTGDEGGVTNIAYTGGTTTNMSGNNDAETFGLDADEWSVVGNAGSASNNVGLNKDGSIRLYYNASGSNTLTITAPNTIATVTITFVSGHENASVKVGGNTVNPSEGVYTINETSFVIGNANTTNVQVQMTNIAVNVASTLVYSDYATTGPKKLALPTFSVAAGTYTATQNVTITAAEGDIYYTLDGTDPTSTSTAYSGAVAITTRGETTLKAIAIDGDNRSDIASAVYNLNLPYTFAELVSENVPDETDVLVSFSKVAITEIDNEFGGVYIDAEDINGNPIEIYAGSSPDESWKVGGLVSGTAIAGSWNISGSESYLYTENDWTGITYTPTYKVTFEAPANGSLVVKNGDDEITSGDAFVKGTTLTVVATPAKGYVLSTLTAGSADIKESKSFTIGTEDVEVSAAFARPYVAIMGEFNSWSGEANPLAVALDEKTASAAITLTLNENYGYGFKVLCGDNTLSIENGSEWYHLKRTWNSAPVKYISDTSNPIWIEMDMSGDYTFTWDYTDSTLTITYPALPEWEYYVGGSFTDWGTNKVKMTTTDEETWTATFELEANKTGENKYEFKIVEKQLGETWLGLQSAASMVYGNCTDWVIGGGEAAIGLETTKKANYTFTYVPATKKVSVDIPNPSPATGVDNTADETKAVKFLENGQIFILRGDKTYTIDGQLVK